MPIFMFKSNDGFKCGSCLWRVNRVFVLASSEEEARKLLHEGNAGLCAECMMDLILELQEKRIITL